VEPRVRIVLQARTTSKRLPAKSLLLVAGMPLAVLCARRLASTGRDVVLATSDDPSDDLLAQTAQRAGLKVQRGSLDNVLNRFVQSTADLADADIVVRATADNPLPDGRFIDALLQEFGRMQGDYLGTSSPSDGLPYGLSAEAFLAGALRRVAEVTRDAHDLENVTTTLRRQAGAQGIVRKRLFVPEDLSNLRVTIDTLQDYLSMAAVFADVEAPVQQDWQALAAKIAAGAAAQPRGRSAASGNGARGSIALGTAQFGSDYGIANRTGRPDDAEAARMLTYAIGAGIALIDTARAYGDAERRIGAFLPPAANAAVKIVTKLRPLDTIPDDAAEREIRAAVDASVYGSCRDLKREQLDILMFHRSADMFRWRGAAANRVAELVDEGVVDAAGASVSTPDEAIACLADKRISCIQVPFNLLDSRWLAESFSNSLARRPDAQVHVRSVFLQGLLTNQAALWPDWVADRQEYVRRIEQFVRDFGRGNAADLCIAYVHGLPWVSTLVLGAETLQQLTELIALSSKPALTPDQVRAVQAGFPGVPMRLLNPAEW